MMNWEQKHTVSLDHDTFLRLARLRERMGLTSVAQVVRFFSNVIEVKGEEKYVIEDLQGKFLGSIIIAMVGGRVVLSEVSGLKLKKVPR